MKKQSLILSNLNSPQRISTRGFGLVVAAVVMFNALAVSFAAASRATERIGAVHPNHFSSAEVRWNEKTGKFEVALSVWPADLEKVLTLLAGKSVDLDKPEGLDELMAGYVADKFLIRKVLPDEVEKFQSAANPPKVLEDKTSEAGLESSPAGVPQDKPIKQSEPASGEGSLGEPSAVPAPSTAQQPAETKPAIPQSAVEDNPIRRTLRHNHEAEPQRPSHISPEDWAERFKPTIAEKLPDGFRWVGFESNLKEAWLYFELAGDVEPATWEIENRIFFEFNEEQVNQIRFSDGKQTRSYSLKINQPRWQFSTKLKEVRGKNSETSRE